MTRKRGAAAEANAAAAKHAAATAAITAAAANIASSRYIFYLAAGRVTRVARHALPRCVTHTLSAQKTP
jgi:hypothetical protein